MILHQNKRGDDISKVYLRSQGPCQRCSMINVDPSSGVNNKGILQALMAERSTLQATTANKVYFGEFFTYHTDDTLKNYLEGAPSLGRNDKCMIVR